MIVGFDISTTTIGYTVLNDGGNVVKMGFIKPTGSDFTEKALNALTDTLLALSGIQVDVIVTEKPSIMFQRGLSSAQTIAQILRFNGAYLFALRMAYHVTPQEVMVSTARKEVLGVGRFPKGVNTKKEVLRRVSEMVQWNWPTNTRGNIAIECFDCADSYVVAKYGYRHRKTT